MHKILFLLIIVLLSLEIYCLDNDIRGIKTSYCSVLLIFEFLLTCVNNLYLIVFNNKQLGKVYGVESFVLGPQESKELYPLLNVDDLYGTLHSPGDGTIDPASWATTLTRAAVKNGGKVTM